MIQKVLLLILLFTVPFSQQMNTNEVEEVFKGVLEGFLSEHSYSHILPCLGDLSSESTLVVEGVENMLTKTKEGIKKGLEQIGEGLETLPEAMIECGEAVNEAKSLINAFAQFKSPLSFAYHVGEDLVVNGINIYKEINQAITDYKDTEYLDMGKQIGKVCE